MNVLIPQWRSAWRFWSVRLVAAGTALTTWALADPDQVTAVLQSIVPPQHVAMVGVVVSGLGAIARIFQQPGLPADPSSNITARMPGNLADPPSIASIWDVNSPTAVHRRTNDVTPRDRESGQ